MRGPRRWSAVSSGTATCAALAAAFACGGEPLARTAEDGLRLTADPQRVTVDPLRVPRIESCADGDVLTGTPDGYRCQSLFGALYDGAVATVGEASRVTTRVAALETGARSPCGVGAGVPAPEIELPGGACFPWVRPGLPARQWWSLGQVLKFRYVGSTIPAGEVRGTCPLEIRCTGGDGVWRRVTVYYLDPDGRGADGELTFTLYEGDHVLDACGPGGCVLRSSRFEATETSLMTLTLDGFVPDAARARRDPNYYRAEVVLERTAALRGELQYRGLRIE